MPIKIQDEEARNLAVNQKCAYCKQAFKKTDRVQILLGGKTRFVHEDGCPPPPPEEPERIELAEPIVHVENPALSSSSEQAAEKKEPAQNPERF